MTPEHAKTLLARAKVAHKIMMGETLEIVGWVSAEALAGLQLRRTNSNGSQNGVWVAGRQSGFATVPLYAVVEAQAEAAVLSPECVGMKPQLWAMHIPGPDDVYPMPSKEYAEQRTVEFNAWIARTFADDMRAPLTAVVIEYPHSAESHAAGLAQSMADWQPRNQAGARP